MAIGLFSRKDKHSRYKGDVSSMILLFSERRRKAPKMGAKGIGHSWSKRKTRPFSSRVLSLKTGSDAEDNIRAR
jgi:hypothetical protein